ncbi:MAG: cation transporter dimerization domain-containing protein, partial [Pseudomonadota bacterium]|nr:cation transporter dimerization domain-containing protein [Pseudomonadota bacterium]
GAHDIRTRQGGKIKFIQMHLELEDSLSLIRAHQVADEVEVMIQTHFACEMDILVHLDPLSVVQKSRQTESQN